MRLYCNICRPENDQSLLTHLLTNKTVLWQMLVTVVSPYNAVNHCEDYDKISTLEFNP